MASRTALLALALLSGCGDGSSGAAAPSSDAGAGAPAELAGPDDRWRAALDAAAAELRGDGVLEQAALAPSDAPARVRRLLRPDAPPGFQAAGPPPAPREPFRVAFTESFAAEQRGERVLLAPDGVLLSDTGLGMPASQVAEALLRLRVGAGTTLQLNFHLARGEVQRVALPVEPSGDWQTLRITDPLPLAHVDDRVIDRVSLGCDPEVPEELLLQVEPVTLVQPGAVYALDTHGWRDVVVRAEQRPALWQSAPGELRLPLPAGHGRRLRGAAALLHPGRDAAAAADEQPVVRLELLAERADGVREPLRELELPAGAPWRDLAVDLPAELDARALVLRTPELPAGTVLAHASWRAIEHSRPPQRVVLLVVDTLRADALACYGHPSNRTPAFDRLAAEGVRFARCYSQAHWTRPSMPSIMTGLYTPATGVEDKFDQLPESYHTLAERFAAGGFRSVAFLANAQAGPAAGLGQGYDALTLVLGQDSDAQLREIVEPRLAALLDDDLFLYVHLMEPHGPYGPEGGAHVEGAVPGTPVEHDRRYDRPWIEQPTDRSRRHYYDVDVMNTDRALAGFLERVVDAWEARGESVVVAAMSDHGEYLGEDGLWGHGKGLLRAEVVHVPLILRAPGRLPAGRVWPRPVENLDVGVTLLELAGLALEPGGADRGRSLLRRFEEPADGGAHVALSTNVSGQERQLTLWGPAGALLGENHALVARHGVDHALRAGAGSDAAHETRFVELWRALRASGEALRAAHWARAGESISELDAASLGQLRELGYLGY